MKEGDAVTMPKGFGTTGLDSVKTPESVRIIYSMKGTVSLRTSVPEHGE